jgi:beta-lactamase class D
MNPAFMKTMSKQRNSLLLVLVLLLVFCAPVHKTETREDFKKFYDNYNVDGSFVLYDAGRDSYVFYNPAQFKQQYTPASTFKICNSLIGLETGVIRDENFVIPWDSVVRHIPSWNLDQDLQSAFRNSTVWYYQELARRVGGERMKYWLDKANYGNMDTTGGIDQFWLTGGLRISPQQQVDFLRRLHDNALPFSQRSMEITRKIMIADSTPGYIICAKSGWGVENNVNIGWYVGYLEKNGRVYYFANCIQEPDSTNNDFAKARIEIVYDILKEMKLISR